MWNEMLIPQTPILETALRAVIAYVVIVILIRFTGKRGLSEMSTFDIVIALLMAELIGGVVLGEDTSITGAVVSALTIVAMNIGFNLLVHRSALASRIFQGKSVTVIRDGELAEGALRKLRITGSEMDHAIRSQHGDDISEVAHGELTPSGKLVLTLKPEEQSATKADIAALKRDLHEVRNLLSHKH